MVSGWRCADCNRTFKTMETFNKHKCKSKKCKCGATLRYGSCPNNGEFV